jgi:hypothetical protein
MKEEPRALEPKAFMRWLWETKTGEINKELRRFKNGKSRGRNRKLKSRNIKAKGRAE